MLSVGEVPPDQVGAVRGFVQNEQIDDQFYRIQFGTQTRTVAEADLELLPEESDPWADLLQGRSEGAATFQKLLTFERLRRPQSRVATALARRARSFYRISSSHCLS